MNVIEDIFGWCGCGQPWSAEEWISQGLECIKHIEVLRDSVEKTKGRKWDEVCASIQAEYNKLGNEGQVMVLLYCFDAAGLTEHGGSVGGCWLTQKGEDLRKQLSDDANPGVCT